MKRKAKIRALGLLLAALLCLPFFPSVARAAEYDPLYPENLEEGHLSATAVLLIEADSGEVIFEKSADTPMHPASTTKILTVWLALTLAENQLDTKFTVSQEAVNLAEDESSAKLAAGEEVALIDLLYAAMLPSGNDAANAIAEGLGGTRENYVALMNQAAQSLGCVNTHFSNPHGLTDEAHYTTARDMAILARVAMQNETFREIVASSSHVMPKDNVYRSRSITNRNDFLFKSEGKEARYYEYSTGIKTGTTEAAGSCFVGAASKDGINLISVVFDAENDTARYTDTIKLMNYGFSQYVSTSIAEIYLKNPRVVDVRGFDLDDPDVGRLTLKIQKVDTAATDLVVTTLSEVEYWVQNFSSLTVTEFTREFRAPITEGEVMGTLTYYPENGNPVVYELTAARSIAAREQLAPTVDEIIAAAEADPNPFPRLTFELVLLYLLLPACGVALLIRGIKLLLPQVKKKTKVRAVKPTGRYYR